MPACRRFPVLAILAAALAGCAATPPAGLQPVPLASHVDLARYMGDWYVIASIPTFLEKGAHNARDTYSLEADGSIATRFTYNADAAAGPVKHLDSRAFVRDAASNAVWGVRFLWPFEADYRIAWLAPDYGEVVVMREKRDNVWIMARTPSIPEADLARLSDFVARQGYDVARLQRVPQDAAR